MDKDIKKYIINTYKTSLDKYKAATNNIGLWDSEKYVYNKYFKKEDKILDIGCGTGRTTFALYNIGYRNITGLDLSEDMLSAAREIRDKLNINIKFKKGNAINLDIEDNTYNKVLFSFNGLMQIPKRKNRLKALKEIRRILKTDGIFIFTTHNRDRGEEFKSFWESEKEKWDKGIQDKRLYEFGDRITKTKNNNSELFIHIPNYNEVKELINKSGFKIIEDFFREDKFNEPSIVKEFSGECHFWVVINN